MFNPIEPFITGMLPVSDGNEIYFEASGNPKGKPALYLHGGPGAGISGGYRKHFDPEKFLIISFEQRGCGRSRPKASALNVQSNTTQALIDDIEHLRRHFSIESWLIYGASWGTTLALVYAEMHPNRVTGLVLGAITTTTAAEVEWITHDIRRIFPKEWNDFKSAVSPKPNERIIDAYYRELKAPELEVRVKAAVAWCAWEDTHVSLDPHFSPDPRFKDPEFCLLFATLVVHYWKHAAFLSENNLLLNVDRIKHLPSVLIHGRLDISSPLETAYNLHQAWPGSELIVVDTEGHGGKIMADEVTRAVARLTGT